MEPVVNANKSPEIVPAGSSNGNSEEKPDLSKFVSIDELAKLKKRLDDQSGIIDELRKAKAEKEKPTPIADKDFGQKLAEIEAKQKATDKDAEDLRDEKITIAFEQALKQSGLSDQHAQDLTRLLKTELQISVDKRVIKVKSGETELEAADFIKKFMETDRGRAYLMPKSNPKSDMNPGNKTVLNGQKVSYTRKDLATGKYDPEVLKKGNFKLTK